MHSESPLEVVRFFFGSRMSILSNKLYEFEEFRLDAENPSLWRGGELVSISPKALEILILLVEKKGEIVTRENLLETVWKETFVEEGNINYTISLLRKALGDKKFVQTVPRRGYRFVAEVKEVSTEIETAQPAISENKDAAQIESKSIVPVQKIKNRRAFLFAAAAAILLLSLFAFSWKSPSESKTKSNLPPKADSMQAYKRGMMILNDKDVENRARLAVDELQQAVTLDPTSAIAHAGLAEGLASTAVSMTNEKSAEFYAKAKIAVEKAFLLDENLFEAHLARGWIRRNGDWDWTGAEEDFKRALEINPKSALAHFRYSQLLSNLGRHKEALAEIEKAAAIDPLSEIILSGHYPLLESAGEYDRALKMAQENVQLNSENPFARRALATFQYHTGDYANVIENGDILFQKSGKRNFAWLSLLAASYLKVGQPEKADEMLRELEAQSRTDKKALYSLAMNYAELGRREEALAALEKCFEMREHRIIWLAVEPRFANLKNEPRFQELLKKMRLD